jgi:hypothetical protein
MKYLVNVTANLLLGWPSLAVGYMVAAIISGFKTGKYMYEDHEEAALYKFCDVKE